MLCFQITRGLFYLHENYIMHRVFVMLWRIWNRRIFLLVVMGRLKLEILVCVRNLARREGNWRPMFAHGSTELQNFTCKQTTILKSRIFGHWAVFFTIYTLAKPYFQQRGPAPYQYYPKYFQLLGLLMYLHFKIVKQLDRIS